MSSLLPSSCSVTSPIPLFLSAHNSWLPSQPSAPLAQPLDCDSNILRIFMFPDQKSSNRYLIPHASSDGSNWPTQRTEPGFIDISRPSAHIFSLFTKSGNKRPYHIMSQTTEDNNNDVTQDAMLPSCTKGNTKCNSGEESASKKARQGSIKEEEEDIRESLKCDEIVAKVRNSITLPDPKQDCDPDDYLRQLLQALYDIEPKVKNAIELGSYFPEISDEQIAAYDILVVTACRENDVAKLKALHIDKGMSVSCCNRFGESLLHMACRRGFREMGQFLLDEANVGVRVRDDCGRTPLHDVCWNPQPQLEMAEALIRRDPTLLLISDKRGHTPFQYSRPQHWPAWRQFCFDQREHLKGLSEDERIKIFCS
jgi:hypothetical protein